MFHRPRLEIMGGLHLVMSAEMQLVATREDHSTSPKPIHFHHLVQEHHRLQYKPA